MRSVDTNVLVRFLVDDGSPERAGALPLLTFDGSLAKTKGVLKVNPARH